MIGEKEQDLMNEVAEAAIAMSELHPFSSDEEGNKWNAANRHHEAAVNALSAFRASKAKAEEVKRCEPAEVDKVDGSWHWLNGLGLEPWCWNAFQPEGWYQSPTRNPVSPVQMIRMGWRYHSVCRPVEPAVFDEDAIIDDHATGWLDRQRKGFPPPAEKVAWTDDEIEALWYEHIYRFPQGARISTEVMRFARELLLGRKP